MKKRKKLPRFKTEEEELRFWDTHSPLDYPDEFKEVNEPFKFDPKVLEEIVDADEKEDKQMISLRIEPSQVHLAKIIAKRRGAAYQSLIRIWIKDKIRAELKDHPEIVRALKERE